LVLHWRSDFSLIARRDDFIQFLGDGYILILNKLTAQQSTPENYFNGMDCAVASLTDCGQATLTMPAIERYQALSEYYIFSRVSPSPTLLGGGAGGYSKI
jgi:hypothetical protein